MAAYQRLSRCVSNICIQNARKFHIWLARQWRTCLARNGCRHRRNPACARSVWNSRRFIHCREARASVSNSSINGREPRLTAIDQPTGTFGIVRTDTQALLGVVSKQYEIVQNDSLLRMAEFIREEVDMDCVIVLSDGAKVCFTATLRGAETDIVPGDTVKRRIVGYLGHDGKTGCGAKFTNIRVVCQNTSDCSTWWVWCSQQHYSQEWC